MKAFGFTGTRQPLTHAQELAVLDIFQSLCREQYVTLHHGDCVGADAVAHRTAEILGLRTVVHPPVRLAHRAFCEGDSTMPQKEYLPRNRAIVLATGLLVAAPMEGPGDPEPRRSGTWYTVRYARSHGREIWFAWPDGSITVEAPRVCGQ